MVESQPAKSNRGWLRWGCACCGGCFVILCCLAFAAASPFALRALGLLGSDAERLYSGAPDLAASAAIEEALVDAGIEGARAVVIPIQGSEGQIAVITVEDSTTTGGNAEEAFGQALLSLSAANQAGFGIERVTVDMRDENGEPGLAITADQTAVEAYSNGEISRSEFLGAVELDISALIDPDQLDVLLEEAGR
jgi:hypothetical protein